VNDFTSFPFFVGSTGRVGLVMILPLDVGCSFSNVISWSSLVMFSRSVRSIRFVVGTVAVFRFVCGCWVVCCPFCPSNNAAISFCIYKTVATILVMFVVDVDVLSYSMYLILFLRFSNL
jgi:hypothetical protein